MYWAMTTVPRGRRAVSAVLGDPLLSEQGTPVDHQADHPDDRHEGEDGDDQNLAPGAFARPTGAQER